MRGINKVILIGELESRDHKISRERLFANHVAQIVKLALKDKIEDTPDDIHCCREEFSYNQLLRSSGIGARSPPY